MNSELLTTGLTLLQQACTLGGISLSAWGLVSIGVNLKEHNGTAISGGIFQFLGGILIVAAGKLFLTAI